MPRIRHIALTTKDPAKTAAFYKEAFGLKEVRRSPNGAVFLTDGHINLAVLNLKDQQIRRCRRAWRKLHRHPPFRVRGRGSRCGRAPAGNRQRHPAHRQGPRRCHDGRRRPRQFRDEMVGPGRRRDRHLAHRLGRVLIEVRCVLRHAPAAPQDEGRSLGPFTVPSLILRCSRRFRGLEGRATHSLEQGGTSCLTRFASVRSAAARG